MRGLGCEHLLFHCTLLADELLERRQLCLKGDLRAFFPSLEGPFTDEDTSLQKKQENLVPQGTKAKQMTYLQVFLRRVLLKERLVPDRLEDVVEHEVGGGDDFTLAVRRVMREVVCLCCMLDREREVQHDGRLTQSGNPRITRANQIDEAESNDGGAAMRRHSRHWTSSRYLPMVRTWML